MEVLLMAILSLSNIACFLIGAKVGQKETRVEMIETPKASPINKIMKHRDKEAEMEKNRFDTILRNIDNYDGTVYGQEDVPGR